MRVQRFSDTPDRAYDTFENVAAREMRPALGDDLVPKRVAHPFVQVPISEDGKLPRLGSNENQSRVAVLVTS